MDRSLREMWESISPKKVASIRKANRRGENETPEMEFRKYLASDFWKFIYVSRHIAYNDLYFFDLHDLFIERLNRYIDEDGYELRCIINAMAEKHKVGSCDYDLTMLSRYEIEGVDFLLKCANEYGYYSWDVKNACETEEIARMLSNNNFLPLPPLPFGSNNEQKARILTFMSVLGMVYMGNDVNIEDIDSKKVQYVIETSACDKNLNKKISEIQAFKKFSEIHVALLRSCDHLPEKDIIELQQSRKVVVPDEFHIYSSPARCVGLMMYEDMMRLECEEGDAIDHFKKSDKYETWSQVRLFHGSTNPYLSDKDNSTLKRWLRTTVRCVESMSVLSFK